MPARYCRMSIRVTSGFVPSQLKRGEQDLMARPALVGRLAHAGLEARVPAAIDEAAFRA